MHYFIDPTTYADTGLLFTFFSLPAESDMDPALTMEVPAPPVDYTMNKYVFLAEEWQVRPGWEAQHQSAEATARLNMEKACATAQAQHWDMMGDAEQAAAWRSYYRELYTLELAPDWPLVAQWPEAPQ